MQSYTCTNKCNSDVSRWLAAPSKCENGGECVTTDQWHACKCQDDGDYYGHLCNEYKCQFNDCDADGTLTDNGCTNNGKDSYTCNCKPGYTGNFCQISPCDSVPCQNDAKCYPTIGPPPFYTCDCKRGYEGPTCLFTPCDNNPCQNEGECTDKLLSGGGVEYICACPEGYSGDECQLSACNHIDDGNRCENGSTCEVTGGDMNTDFKCACLTGFLGRTCEDTPCKPVNPCNDGRCTVDGDSFTVSVVTSTIINLTFIV